VKNKVVFIKLKLESIDPIRLESILYIYTEYPRQFLLKCYNEGLRYGF